jgi:hypothetical protein
MVFPFLLILLFLLNVAYEVRTRSLDVQAGGLTHAAMVSTMLLVGPLAGFVAVVAGTRARFSLKA